MSYHHFRCKNWHIIVCKITYRQKRCHLSQAGTCLQHSIYCGIFTALVRSTREGNVFTLFVSLPGRGREAEGSPARTRTGYPLPCPVTPLPQPGSGQGTPWPAPPHPLLASTRIGYSPPCPHPHQPLTKTRAGYLLPHFLPIPSWPGPGQGNACPTLPQPLTKIRTGYLDPDRTGTRYPFTPGPEQDMPQTGYGTGRTPLAFSSRRTFLFE